MTSDRTQWTILTQYYRPEVGAPQVRLAAIAEGLLADGGDVRVVTGMPNYPTGKVADGYRRRLTMRETIDGVKIRRCWLFPAAGRSALRRVANYLSFTVTAMIAVLFGPRPDILVVEGQPLTLGFVALALRRLRGVPYVYIVPDMQIDVARQLGFVTSPLVLGWAEKLEDRSLREAWKVATVTRAFTRRLEERGVDADRMTFLPNGADTERMIPLPPDHQRRTEARLGDRRVITYVGSFSPYHDLDTVLGAASCLRHDSGIVFWLLGDGSERERLESWVESEGLDNVEFGWAPPDDLAAIYSITDVAVASLADMPVARDMRLAKVFPALSCGVPVVLAGAGEGADLISEAGCGLVVAPGEPEELAEALRSLATDQDRRDKFGQAGREFVVRDYSWPDIVRRWLAEVGTVDTGS